MVSNTLGSNPTILLTSYLRLLQFSHQESALTCLRVILLSLQGILIMYSNGSTSMPRSTVHVRPRHQNPPPVALLIDHIPLLRACLLLPQVFLLFSFLKRVNHVVDDFNHDLGLLDILILLILLLGHQLEHLVLISHLLFNEIYFFLVEFVHLFLSVYFLIDLVRQLVIQQRYAFHLIMHLSNWLVHGSEYFIVAKGGIKCLLGDV